MGPLTIDIERAGALVEETFVLQKPFGHSGRVELGFTEGGLRHEDALSVHRYGRTGERDSLVKTAVSPAGTKVLRREADAYSRISGRHAAFGRLLGFRTAQEPVCVMVSRRGVPVSRCDPGLRLDATQLDRAARDLFGALAVLAELGFAHRAVSADSVFWDGLRIELQEFGHVEPLGPIAGLDGSALGSPTGLPVSDVPDVQAAARVVYRLATGGVGGPPTVMLGQIARIAPPLAEALEPALHPRNGQVPTPAEMVERLRRSRPPATPPATQANRMPPRTDAPPPPDARSRPDRRPSDRDAHRVEFRELRRRQREFGRAAFAETRHPPPGTARMAGSPPRPAPTTPTSAGGGGSRSWLLYGGLAGLAFLLLVLVVS
jgi:hypothetical protein